MQTSPLIAQLCRHEGFSAKPYLCTAGKETLGFGYNCEANPLLLSKYTINNYRTNGITRPEALVLLTDQVKEIRHALESKLPWWSKLVEARQSCLINMSLNLGVSGLLKFKDTLVFLEHGEYYNAAHEMLDSDWATQVKGRATELAAQMRTGKYA